MYGYNQYDPNQGQAYPAPGTILPAGQTIDGIYAQSYSNLHQATAHNRYDAVGVEYNTYQHNPYAQPQQPSQDYPNPQPALPQPPPYESELSQRFKVNPSYADAVHIDGAPYGSSSQQYSSTQYPPTDQYSPSTQYSPTDQYPASQQYPPGATADQYSQPPADSYSASNYNVSQPYQSQYNTPQPSPSYFGSYSPTMAPVQPSQDQWQSQPTQWQPTQPAPATQWNTPVTHQPSSHSLYPSLSNTSLPTLPSQSNLQPQSSNTNLQAQPSYTNLQAQPSYTNLQAPSNTNLQAQPSNMPPSPRVQNSPSNNAPSPRISPAMPTASPTLTPSQGSPTTKPAAAPSAAQNKLLQEERLKMEREREELAKQQELIRQKKEELKKQEEALKVLHAQEEQKLRSEIERQREEVAKMKEELAKQSNEQKQQQAQKDKIVEVQKEEMKRQMEELMKERELVKKHEEEMRNAVLEEQRLMLQQLKQQQSDLSQQQQSMFQKAQEAEIQRQQEHQRKIEAQRKHEQELLIAKQAIDQQQQALQRQMEEAKEATRKMEERQRLAAEQQQKAEAQQKQTEEQKRLAEEKRKQAEEQFRQAVQQQKQQQEAFAKQQEDLRKRQEQLAAEQERMRGLNSENESKIESEKKQLNDKLREQQRLLQQQQDEIKRQQELVTLQQKELLVKQKEQQETVEKEKAATALKDLLAPMRHSAGSTWQPAKSPVLPGAKVGDTQTGTQATQKPLAPQPPPRVAHTPPPAGTRRDSRMLVNLDLNQVVQGYLLRDVVRAQRYVRRWLLRRHFVKLVTQYRSSDDKTAEKLRHRNKSLREIYTSELSYVANLQLLSNFYVVPMHVESMVKQSFSDKDTAVIFSSINTLLDVSKGLVAELEARLDKWPSVQLFGDIFVRLAPIMKLYAEYINNFDAATQRLKALLAVPEGYQFFESCKAKSRSNLDIHSLLIMPVQRVPRYELLLKELIKFTEESHVDYQNLSSALKAIQQVNTYINQKKKDVDSRQKLTTIQNTVKGCPNLTAAHRYFVYEGNLQVSSTDKHKTGLFYFFLFNDLLMATKKVTGLFHHRHDYEYVFSIDLSEAVVKSVPDNLMFRIMSGGLEDINVAIFTFLCQTNAEKDIWMKNFVIITQDPTNTKKLLVKEASVGNFHP